MSYLKPQTPLQHKDGDYFYPLTTIDQVIMEDGITRLNGADLISVNTDGAPEGETVKVNADTLGGISADEYATKIFVQNEIAEAQFDGSNLDDIKTYVNNQITNRVIHSGGKNLLKNTAKSQTINGVTFTVNDNGSVTLNGTNNTQSADTDFYIWGSNADNGSYIHMPKGSRISGFTENGGNYLVICREKTRGALLTTYGINSALAESDCYFYGIFYRVSAGITVDNVTLYPMLSLASETDDTYEPYYEGLKEVHNKLSMELLWENASPTSEMGGGVKITSKDNYDAFLIECRLNTSSEQSSTELVMAGKTCRMRSWNKSGTTTVTRYVSTGKNYVNFSTGVNGNEDKASELIPVRVFGIKGVLA